MSEFFSTFGEVVTFLNDWKLFGSVSVWGVLLTCLVIGVIANLVKGKNS